MNGSSDSARRPIRSDGQSCAAPSPRTSSSCPSGSEDVATRTRPGWVRFHTARRTCAASGWTPLTQGRRSSDQALNDGSRRNGCTETLRRSSNRRHHGHRCAPCRIRKTIICSSRSSYIATKGSGGNAISRVPWTRPTRPRRGKFPRSGCARPRIALRVVPNQDGPGQCNRRPVRDHRLRPWSSGRASAAISAIHASGDVIVLEQSAFSCGGAALFDFGPEPLVVVHRAG
jgi:hypothetical protein